MSHLSEELERQFTLKNINAWQLSEMTKISSSQIYKWTKSEQTSISVEQISALALALSDDPRDHAALIRAHLLDEKFGPGSNLVSVEISTRTLELKDSKKPRSKGEIAMIYLAEQRISNKDVNDLVIDLARCLGAEI